MLKGAKVREEVCAKINGLSDGDLYRLLIETDIIDVIGEVESSLTCEGCEHRFGYCEDDGTECQERFEKYCKLGA